VKISNPFLYLAIKTTSYTSRHSRFECKNQHISFIIITIIIIVNERHVIARYNIFDHNLKRLSGRSTNKMH